MLETDSPSLPPVKLGYREPLGAVGVPYYSLVMSACIWMDSEWSMGLFKMLTD
jgi:hypothetical protein